MNVEKPVFILGCPRSGTTIFMDILSFHENFSWPSQYINKWPSLPQLAFLSRVYDLPIVGSHLKKLNRKLKLAPKPVEAWNYYRSIDPNFYPYPRSSPKVQASPPPPSKKIIKKFKKSVNLIQKYQGKTRFIAKYTNKPRIKYLNSIFPDAIFIHILRDGRAVVNSLYNKVKQAGWILAPEREQWTKTFPDSWQENIQHSTEPDITFLAYYYRHIVARIFEEQKELGSQRTITIKYEDFTTNATKTFLYCMQILEIPWTKEFADYLHSNNLESQNYKWKQTFSPKQIEIVNSILDGFPIPKLGTKEELFILEIE